MRILYLHQYFNTPDMNGSTRSYEFGKRLVVSGHEVHILTSQRVSSNSDSGRWTTEKIEGMTVYWLNCKYSNRMSFARRVYAFLYFAIHATLKGFRIECDVLFATSTPLTIAIPGILISKCKRIPMVFEVRDLWPEVPIAIGALKSPVLKYLAKKLESVAYSCSECIIALSPGMRDGIVKSGYEEKRVAIIPNSCDGYFKSKDERSISSFRESRPWLKGSKLFVYTGTFGEINGVGYLVELAAAVKSRCNNIKFLLVGQGKELELISKLATDLNVLNINLFIEGAVSKHDIPTMLHASSMASSVVIDIPELNPNSANKFFDALASGTPMFINYGGWQEELINNEQIGLAVHGLEYDEVANLLCDFMNNSDTLSDASLNAASTADKLFDRDKLSVRFEKVLALGCSRNGSDANLYGYDVL